MIYTIYNSSGEIVSTLTAGESETAAANLEGKTYIDGYYSADEYYIADSQPVAKGSKPSDLHLFDYNTKTWIIDELKVSMTIRSQRDHLLSIIDKINPIWYSTLTYEQQQELINYRQALLDVPQQSGFPQTITWPIQPDWI